MDIQTLCPRPQAFQGQRHDGYLALHEALPKAAEAKVGKWMEALSELYEAETGVKADLTKLPKERQRQLYTLAENIRSHHGAALASGHPEMLMSVDHEAQRRLRLTETVTTSDIATFTKQQLVYLVDVFAPWIISDIFTTVTMTGPTAFIHRQTLTREGASTYYDAGSALNEGLDPSYSDCPTECAAANGIDVEVTAELVTADCSRLSAEYCIPANYHFSSQYNGNLANVLGEAMRTEMQRAIQAKLLALLVASAGFNRSWSRTPAGGSYFATAHPDEWLRELRKEINAINRDVLKAADGRVATNIIVGDVDGLGAMEDPIPMQYVDEQPGNIIDGRTDEMTQYMGTTKVGRFRVYRALEGLPNDTLIVMHRNDRDPTAVYAPWVPFTSLGMHTDPKTARVSIGAISLYGSAVLRPNRIGVISLAA